MWVTIQDTYRLLPYSILLTQIPGSIIEEITISPAKIYGECGNKDPTEHLLNGKIWSGKYRDKILKDKQLLDQWIYVDMLIIPHSCSNYALYDDEDENGDSAGSFYHFFETKHQCHRQQKQL